MPRENARGLGNRRRAYRKRRNAADAARRELFEETGATDFTLRPLFDYAVRRAYGWANGRVYLAGVQSFGPLSPFEMAEIREMDAIPQTMRFPRILPALYDAVCRQVES